MASIFATELRGSLIAHPSRGLANAGPAKEDHVTRRVQARRPFDMLAEALSRPPAPAEPAT